MKKYDTPTSRLLRAAGQGRHHVARMLLDSGVDVTAGGDHGETCLHSAAGGGCMEMVRYLMRRFGAVDCA